MSATSIEAPTAPSGAPSSSVSTSLAPSDRIKGGVRDIDEAGVTARVHEILNRHPAVGLAVGVVRNGSLDYFYGHGLADIALGTPITQDTVFRIASITKTFTAIAVMQLWEQGLLDLDAPANYYLRAYKLIPAKAGFRPATVGHLLTHTAGVPQIPRPWRALTTVFAGSALTESGDSYGLEQPLPTLAEYYGGGLRLTAEPGTRYTYGDHGFATLGQIVEDVSRMSLAQYFREHIFEPLGMTGTDLLRSESIKAHLATGYSLSSAGPEAVTDRNWVTSAASSIYSTPRDMARYLAALLGGGANQYGSVLKPDTLAAMFEPHHQTDPRVPGMGLGFSRADFAGHLAVEHQGLLPGFNSQIWVAPHDGVGVMGFTNGARNAVIWLTSEVAGLLRQQLGVPDDTIRTDIPQRPDLWGDLCGWYQPSAAWTDLQARGLVGLGAEVFARGGQFMMRGLSPLPVVYRGFPLHPDDENDPYVFRIDLTQFGIGTFRVVFSQEPGVGTTGLHTDLVPLSLRKQPKGTNPRLWLTGGLGALAVVSAAGATHRFNTRARRTAPNIG